MPEDRVREMLTDTINNSDVLGSALSFDVLCV